MNKKYIKLNEEKFEITDMCHTSIDNELFKLYTGRHIDQEPKIIPLLNQDIKAG